MAHIHHPLLGDKTYGGYRQPSQKYASYLIKALQTFKRQALHARWLSFNHPTTHQPISFTLPLPDDMKNILTLLANEQGKN